MEKKEMSFIDQFETASNELEKKMEEGIILGKFYRKKTTIIASKNEHEKCQPRT